LILPAGGITVAVTGDSSTQEVSGLCCLVELTLLHSASCFFRPFTRLPSEFPTVPSAAHVPYDDLALSIVEVPANFFVVEPALMSLNDVAAHIAAVDPAVMSANVPVNEPVDSLVDFLIGVPATVSNVPAVELKGEPCVFSANTPSNVSDNVFTDVPPNVTDFSADAPSEFWTDVASIALAGVPSFVTHTCSSNVSSDVPAEVTVEIIERAKEPVEVPIVFPSDVSSVI